MRRDIDMQDAAGGMFHHDKDIEQTKGGRDDDTEVARDDRLRLVPDKSPPALGRRTFAVAVVPVLGHVLADRAWRHPQKSPATGSATSGFVSGVALPFEWPLPFPFGFTSASNEMNPPSDCTGYFSSTSSRYPSVTPL